MTVEEIEIIVTAKVEEALKEFQKILPTIKQSMKQAQEAFSKVDTKTMTNKLHQAVQFMKKKMQDFKKSSENNEIAIKINNKDAQKQISQIEKEIDSLQKKITGRQLKLDITNNTLDKIRNDTNQSVIKEMPEAGNKQIKQETYKRLDNNTNYNSLVSQSNKLNKEIEKYNELLNTAKSKMAELGQQTSQTATTQSKLSSFFSIFKQKIEQVKPSISNMKNSFKNLPKITQNITNNIKGMGAGLKQGLGHVLKYAGALLSLRGIYSTLSSCAQSWLSSQNAGAQQLSANIDYMKYAMGSALAPVIQFVTNLVYQLMKAIQSVAYALTGVNIFAKASASSYASMAGSAKKAKEETKQLAGVHDEINNVQTNKNNDSGSGGTTSPSFDLSGIDNQMSPLAQKLYDFFKPLKESWDNYGGELIAQLQVTAGQVVELISSVWGSFEKIITNGTVYTTLELILAIIGNIAEAFSNAWNYNGNGDAIVQNLANAFNNLLGAINNVVQSEGFQNWLNNCSDKFRVISEKLAEIDWQPLINALSDIGQNIGTLALDILSGMVDIFKWFVEHPDLAMILFSIATAIILVVKAVNTVSEIATAIKIFKELGIAVSTIISTIGGIALVVVGAVASISSFVSMLKDGFSWVKEAIMLVGIALVAVGAIILGAPALITAIIAGIVAIVATAIVVIKEHWEDIKQFFINLWENIKTKAEEIWNAIADFFKNLWQGICDTATNIWNSIKEFLSNLWNGISNTVQTVFNAIATFFSNIWNGIKNVVSTVWNAITTTISNVINGIKNTISNVLNGIKTIWNNIWNGLKTTVTNIFNGIWNTIKGVINSILGGIEGMANGIVKGINKVIDVLNNLQVHIPDWIPLFGGKDIGFHINHLNTVSLPRLAKGGVLYDETLVMAGEYSGAKSNPEIVTPQNIMRETMEDVFSDYLGNNEQPISLNLTVNVSNKKLGQILLEDLRDKTRRTGKNIEALVGG